MEITSIIFDFVLITVKSNSIVYSIAQNEEIITTGYWLIQPLYSGYKTGIIIGFSYCSPELTTCLKDLHECNECSFVKFVIAIIIR